MLARLPLDVRAGLLELGAEQEFPRNEQLMVSQGRRSAQAMLLVSGLVKVAMPAEDGRVVMLGLVRGGDLAGEMTAIAPWESPVRVVTCVHTVARMIDGRVLKEFLRRQPEAHFAVDRMIIERLREANRRRADAGLSALCRLARVLLELVGTCGRLVDGKYELLSCLTQAELGSMAGMASRTAEVQLGELQKLGIVESSYRKIMVTSVVQLRKVAQLPLEIPQ